jgi:hypothetical protein
MYEVEVSLILHQKSLVFLKPNGSLPYSKEPAVGPYHEL